MTPGEKKERVKASNHRYYMAHREQRRERYLRYKQERREELREYHTNYCREYQHRLSLEKQTREAAELGIPLEVWQHIANRQKHNLKECEEKFGITPLEYLSLSRYELCRLQQGTSYENILRCRYKRRDMTPEERETAKAAAERSKAEREQAWKRKQREAEAKRERIRQERERARAERQFQKAMVAQARQEAEKRHAEEARKAEARRRDEEAARKKREQFEHCVAARNESRGKHAAFMVTELDVLKRFINYQDPVGRYRICIITKGDVEQVFRTSNPNHWKAVWNLLNEKGYFIRAFVGGHKLLIHEADDLLGSSRKANRNFKVFLTKEEERK